MGFPGGAVVQNLPANAGATGDAGSITGSGRSSGEGNVNPLQYSCLGNPKDSGAWQAIVHGVAKSQTRLSNWAHTQLSTHLKFFFLRENTAIHRTVTEFNHIQGLREALIDFQESISFWQLLEPNAIKWEILNSSKCHYRCMSRSFKNTKLTLESKIIKG